MTTIQPFDPDFVTQYQDSFDEILRLGRIAAENRVLGKQTAKEDKRIGEFLKVLRALSIAGLSGDDIESLEYDLIGMNEGMVVPTVDAIVGITPNRKLRINTPASLRYTRPDLRFETHAHLVLEPKVFTRTKPAINFIAVESGIIHATIALDTKELTRTDNSIALTGYVATLDIETELLSTFGGSTFRISFSGAARTFTLVQGFDLLPVSDSGTIDFPDSQPLTVTVKKMSNGGIAQDAGTIVWRKNGIDQSNYNFVLGENLGGAGKAYAYSGLVDSDEISIYIGEG